jgi:hypothetical protein
LWEGVGRWGVDIPPFDEQQEQGKAPLLHSDRRRGCAKGVNFPTNPNRFREVLYNARANRVVAMESH